MFVAIHVALVLQSSNTLSPQEIQQGWKLLFDGKSTAGWHNYKGKGVASGWKIVDGTLKCADPETAGDILTNEKYDWFELSVDFNVDKGQNSGIMFRVTEDGEYAWHSGPEVQIYDHPIQKGVETTGFLYQLYTFEKELAKPAGEWNRMVIVISPEKCFTELNGTRCYEFVYGSPDFWARVAKSKFNKFPQFGKASAGSIAIQGDHGVVSFKNVKIRRITK